ncbi:MAG: hypothetical protein QXR09_01400 [Candidatus Aenigmatarchaeota archaeon]
MELKGLAFTTDILIGLTLVISLIPLFYFVIESNYPETSFQSLTYQANDLIEILANLKASSFSNTSTISMLLSNKIISETDLNKTLLDLIGTFWYSGNKSIASNITKEVLEGLTEKCFSLQTHNETIYSSCSSNPKTVSVAYRLESGYEIGKPVSGYVARAWATKVRKNTTQIIIFYPEGSGWTAQRLEITKNFALPTNITIYNATLYVSIHFGTSKSQAQFEQLKINDVQKKNDIKWLYMQEEAFGWEITTAAYGVVDVTNEIQPGNNSIYLVIGTPNYHSHIHPGMRLIVTYSLSQELSTGNKSFKKRYYFDNVVGRTGAWSMVSFYIPENAKNAKAQLHLKTLEVDDTVDLFGRNSSDVIIYFNSGHIFYKDGYCSSQNCYPSCSISGLYYRNCRKVGVMNPELFLNLTNNLTIGTNVISVYLNNYGDVHWGDQKAIIYSDPLNDPEGSSYVEVYYEMEEPTFNYGEIDITREMLFGGSASNPKTFNFTLNQSQNKVIEAFVHIAQGFSSMVNASINNFWIFTSPSIRVVPENVYVYPNKLSVGKNSIRLVDFQEGGSISGTNYILPWSSFEYTYLVKGLVGYGNVFNSSQLAIEDAKQRLISQMGEEGIKPEGIQVDSQSVQGLRWLWGPSLFKILVWERE